MDGRIQIGLVNHQGQLLGLLLHLHLLHVEQLRGVPRLIRTLQHRRDPGESPPLVLHLFEAFLLQLIKKNTDFSSLFFFFSKSHLNGCAPDYSKVKPRVHFPKVGYKPARSRSCSKGESSLFRPPVGAESVEEDSRGVPDVPPATSDAAGECQELESPREATRLLSELEVRFQPERI